MSTPIVYVATDGMTGTVLYAGTDATAALIYGRPTTPSGHNIVRTYLDGRLWGGTPTVHLYAPHYTTDAPDDGFGCRGCGGSLGRDGHPYFHHYPFPV